MLATNQTSATLRFAVELPDELLFTGALLRPGETTLVVTHIEGSPDDRNKAISDGCVAGDLVAFDLDGREVARHPPPLCFGETWTIAEPR